MAYLRELPTPRCRECSARATVELVNRYNATFGFFCRRHGVRAERELQALEGQPVGEDTNSKTPAARGGLRGF